MSRAYASTVIPLDADAVWSYVRDFGRLNEWHPAVAECVVEDRRPGDAVGSIRHLRLTDGAELRERMLQMNEIDRSYTYEFVESPFPVRSYVSTIRFTPITDVLHTFADWWADFDSDEETEPGLRRTFGTDVFSAGLTALREILATPT